MSDSRRYEVEIIIDNNFLNNKGIRKGDIFRARKSWDKLNEVDEYLIDPPKHGFTVSLRPNEFKVIKNRKGVTA